MGRLILRFLGAPEVSHTGKLLTFPTRKVLALLAYLAIEQGRHSRDKLTALLWPDSDEERGKGSLRRTLAYLREALEESPHERSGNSSLSHLLVEHDALSFNLASDFDLDLHTLQVAFQLARSRPPGDKSADLGAQLACLQTALALYRGNFLDGLALPDAPDFEDWLLLQRETWHKWATKVFDRLSELQTEGGELEHALESTTRWVAHDPHNEVARARLIELHYALGDRAAALRVYENYRAFLERELNTEPASGTIALAESIRAQSPPVRVQTPHEPRPTQTSLELPLTGRITEHLALVTAYSATRQGRMQVVTLEGEPGIGKSRLAREFLLWARARGADVLEGHAFETGGRLSYQPLIEALRHRLEREKHLQKLLNNTWLAELTRVLPELRERYPTLPTPLTLDESEAHTRLFEAVSRLGQSLAERSPIIFFIEDAQWADAASLDVLHYVSRRWTLANVPVLLVMTLRSEDLASSLALANWLAGLERILPVKRILLAPLTFEDTLRLMESLSRIEGNGARKSRELPGTLADGRARLEAFSQQLFTETGGHPFFLIETLKSLAEHDILQSDEAGEWTIDFDAAAQRYATQRDLLPSGVRELIHTRLTHLSPNALAACMAGAVLGQGFDLEQLCRVADLSESQGLPALDELLMRGLFRETGGRCSFVHDRVREVAYAEAGEVRRRVFHRRALEELEVANVPAAEMARHARGAGMLERAFTLSLEAGDEAMRLFAVRDAIGHYAWARYLVTQSMPTHLGTSSLRRDLYQLYAQLGRVFELNSEREKARATYETMLALARKYSIPEMECAALNALAMLIAQDLRIPEQARALLRQALVVAETSRDTPGLVQTEWNLAQSALYSLDREMALFHSERALSLARELNMKEFIAQSLNQLALIELQWCKGTKAEAYAQEAMALYALLGNRAMEVDSMVHLAYAQLMGGKPEEGITTARSAHSISLEIENALGAANSAQILALGLCDRGEYGEALEIARTGVAQARVAGYPPLLVSTLWCMGNMYRLLFALDAAYTAHTEAKAIAETFSHPMFTDLVLAGLCADAVAAGDWQEAYICIQQALTIRHYEMPYVGYIRWYGTEALLRAGEEERAAQDARRFGEGAGNTKRYRIPYLRSLAVLAQYRGEIDQAIGHLQEAATLAEEIGLPGELWSILATLGELSLTMDDGKQSRSAFRQAATIVRELAEKVGDDDRRANFLSSPSVSRVLEEALPGDGKVLPEVSGES